MDSLQPIWCQGVRAVGVLWSGKTILARLAVSVWVILVMLAVGRAALSHLPRHCGSYAVFAGAARHWQTGEDLYDHNNPNSLTVYRNCPLVALLLAPLAWLPTAWGNAALRCVGLALLLPGLWWWNANQAGAALTPRRLQDQRAWFFLLVAALCNHSMMDVQLTVPTLGLLLITIEAAAQERWNVSAAACSLAIAIKAYPVALALCLALLFPRQFGWRLLAIMACLFLVPFLFQEPAYVLRQQADWLHLGLNPRYVDNWFCDAMSFSLRWGMPMSRPTFQILEVLSGLGVAVCCLLWLRRQLPRRALLNGVFGLCCAWMLAFGPATEATTYILLAPALGAAALLAWTRPQPWWYRAAITISCVLLALAQLELLFPLDKPLAHLAAQPFAAVVFLVAVAVRGLGDVPTPAFQRIPTSMQGGFIIRT